MNAVVTAGGRVDGTYAAAAATRVKALARVRGETMLGRVLRALRGAGVERVAIVGGDEVRAACAGTERVVDESVSGAENVLRALRAWPEDGRPLLYATSDMPYVTPEAVADFVTRAPADAVAIALAEHAGFAARFPGAPAFGITLAGQRVVNGGLFWIPAGARGAVARLATEFFEARKRPWRMASMVGPWALLRFALRRLSVADVEAVATRALGVRSVAVRGCAPELGFDADTVDEYRYACQTA